MICLQNKGCMGMLYVLGPDEAAKLREGFAETMRKGDWFVRTSRTGGRALVLATKGKPEDFPMPF